MKQDGELGRSASDITLSDVMASSITGAAVSRRHAVDGSGSALKYAIGKSAHRTRGPRRRPSYGRCGTIG